PLLSLARPSSAIRVGLLEALGCLGQFNAEELGEEHVEGVVCHGQPPERDESPLPNGPRLRCGPRPSGATGHICPRHAAHTRTIVLKSPSFTRLLDRGTQTLKV